MKPQINVLFLLPAALALAAATATSAVAQVSSDEAKCRTTIAKAAGKYSKLALKSIEKCHKLRNKETLPALTDCNVLAEADPAGKAEKAADKLRALVGGEKDKCAVAGTPIASVLAEFGRCPAPAEASDDGGSTTGIDDYSELAECLIDHARLIAESSMSKTLGLPSVPLSKEAAKCHSTLAKSLTKVSTTTVKERTTCQKTLDKTAPGIGFDCATSDGKGKIATTKQKSKDKINTVCAAVVGNPLSRAGAPRTALAELDSCADSLIQLADCVVDDNAGSAGAGVASMLWELPGICPGSGSYFIVPVATESEFDIGYTGFAHDVDPILGYRGVQYEVVCDQDCANCVNPGPPTPVAGACRCDNDASTVCSASGADPACGGGTCRCYYGPPAPFPAAGVAVCVTTEIDGALDGFLEPGTGAVELDIAGRVRLYTGPSIGQPCPLCEAGVCSGGDRDGLACSVDGTDETFGSVSFDCPPSAASNVSGGGMKTRVLFTTGAASLGFGVPCGGVFSVGQDCPCATCSGDNSIACSSDLECSDAGAGTCTANFDTERNSCVGGVCSPDPGSADPAEGACLAGPIDKYCDGFVASNGKGIISCGLDSDCDFSCPLGIGLCGNCTLDVTRDCFMDPISAQGKDGEVLVGVGCIGRATSNAVNQAAGFPGPERIRQNLAAEILCSDGVTPYVSPGGSTCP